MLMFFNLKKFIFLIIFYYFSICLVFIFFICFMFLFVLGFFLSAKATFGVRVFFPDLCMFLFLFYQNCHFSFFVFKQASRPYAADLYKSLKPSFSTISLRLKIPDPPKNHQHLLPHLFRPISKNRFFQFFIKSENLHFRPSKPYSDHF